MSPEQWQGLTLDARSDVYSFGLVVQELLAGRRLESVDSAAPRALLSLPADVPAELRTIVAKALEQDPADRYQSMRDLVVDLRRIGRQSDAAPARPAWARAGSYMLVALAVLALGVFTFEQMRGDRGNAPARNAIVVLPFANETGDVSDVHISEGLGDDLRERLMALPGLSVQARTSSVSFRDQNVDLRTVASRLAVGLLVNGSVRRQGKTLDVVVEILDDRGFAVRPPLRFERQDTEMLAMQQEIAKQVGAYLVPESSAAAAAKPTTPTEQSESANMLILFGSHREHEVKDEISVDDEKLQQAIDYYRRATVADPTSLSAHSHLAAALLYRGDIDAASASLKTMLDLAEAPKAQTTPTELSDAYYTWALYLARTRSAGMDRALQAAIRLNPNHADALGAYGQWLLTHAYAGADGGAGGDGYFRDAIRLDRQSLSRYADYAEYLGTLEKMSQLRSLALEIEERFPSARGFAKLARLYELAGDLDVGIAWGLRAYRALRQEPAPPGESAVSRQQLERDIDGQIAELYARIGAFDEASRFEPELGIGQLFFRQRYSDLVTVAQESVLQHPEDPGSYLMLAFAYNATGDFASARYLLEQRLGFPRSTLTDDGTALEVLPGTIYRDALQSLGAEAGFVRKDAASFAAQFEKGVEHGLESSWYINSYLACAQAQLDRVGDALDSFDRIKASQGFAWLPLLEDSPCFKRVAKEQRYAALIEDLKDRQRKLRDRLPTTLREYGVADVRP
jgi:TolB-like protein/cytochrome c-type biogenesis protein CcmH/NrfG